MLREMADYTVLMNAVNGALADSYRGPWLHAPARGLTGMSTHGVLPEGGWMRNRPGAGNGLRRDTSSALAAPIG